jgi:hypothetical protein
MRRILIEGVRRKRRLLHGGGREREEFHADLVAALPPLRTCSPWTPLFTHDSSACSDRAARRDLKGGGIPSCEVDDDKLTWSV